MHVNDYAGLLSDQHHEEVLGFCNGRRCERVVGGVDGLLSGLAYRQFMSVHQLHQIAIMPRHVYKSLMK